MDNGTDSKDNVTRTLRRRSGTVQGLIKSRPRSVAARLSENTRLSNPTRFDSGELSLFKADGIVIITRTTDIGRYITASPPPDEAAFIGTHATRDALMRQAAILLGGEAEPAPIVESDPAPLVVEMDVAPAVPRVTATEKPDEPQTLESPAVTEVAESTQSDQIEPQS